jgi:hypothetical protein
MQVNFEVNPVKYKGIANHRLNYFADIVEMIALIAKSEISIGEILDRFNDCGLIQKGSPEKNDLDQKWVEDIFSLIESRAIIFKDKYPFIYDTGVRYIIIKESLAKVHMLYIQLLISANLPFFTNYQSILTSDFENISYYSLQGYLGKATTKQFGKNSNYSGNAQTKIRSLADDIKLLCNDNELQGISKFNSNEKGLDIVAWIPFDDDWGNLIVILGQCACENDEWFKKQHDTRRYENYFKFKSLSPIHALFIPHSLSKQDDFYETAEIINGTLLFERKRILETINEESYSHIHNSRQIIEDLLNYREDIV